MNIKLRNLILSAISLTLCCAIVLMTCFCLSFNGGESTAESEAAEVSSVASSKNAQENTSAKEEVVYIGIDAYGNVTDINVVNIFGSGDITDYGEYTSVKMMTTNDEISISGDEVTFSTDEERVYYQGTLSSSTEIPWDISITYYMNGTEYSAEEIAGMSGSLKIEINITENEDFDGEGDFYDSFMLQATLTLDTENASDITAEGATTAIVGSDKQFTYMVLPGYGLEAEITAEVTDFEMDAISINGVLLGLDIDIDDEELQEKIDEVMDAVSQINDGAGEVSDGSDELVSGASSVNSGASALAEGASELNSGISELSAGMSTLESGLSTLNDNSGELTDGSAQILEALETIEAALADIDSSTDQLEELADASQAIQEGIDSLNDGILSLQSSLSFSNYKTLMAANGLDIDTLVDGNTQAIAEIEELLSLLETIRTYIPEDTINTYLSLFGIDTENIFDELEEIADNMILLFTGNSAAISGMEAYLDALESGTDELAEGAAALAESYAEFNEAIGTLTSSLSSMLSEMVTLKAGVEALVESYEALDDGLNEYTDGVAEVVAGYSQLVSGVTSLSSGSKELLSGSSTLASGTAELYSGAAALSSGSSELSDGTQEFYDELSETSDEAMDVLDELLDMISGDAKVSSFVSSKNTNVEAVQFVITSTAVEIEEEETEEETEEDDSNFWDKLSALFD